MLFIVMSVITGFDWAENDSYIIRSSGSDKSNFDDSKNNRRIKVGIMEKLDVNKDYTLLADKQRYVNHTYLKKFDAFGFAYIQSV
ncbi:MAG: hypothetical protein ACLR7D_02780 [Lachnospira eligens]